MILLRDCQVRITAMQMFAEDAATDPVHAPDQTDNTPRVCERVGPVPDVETVSNLGENKAGEPS
jgi:hypothetical protein